MSYYKATKKTLIRLSNLFRDILLLFDAISLCIEHYYGLNYDYGFRIST